MSSLGSRPIIASAIAHHNAGRIAEAEAEYRKVLRANPNDHDALHLLGLIVAQRGDLATGLGMIRRAIELFPGYPSALGNLGRLLAGSGRVDEAISAFEKLVALTPKDFEAWYSLGVLLRMSGRPEAALPALEECLRYQPQHVAALTEQGNILVSLGRMHEALNRFTLIAQFTPQDPSALNNLGSIYVEVGQHLQALAEFDKAIAIQPNNAVFHTNRGAVLIRLNRPADALAAFDIALRFDDRYLPAHNGRGQALAKMSRFEEAVEAHRRALELEPEDLKSHEALGETLIDKGDVLDAEPHFTKLLAADPNSVSALKGLAVTFRALGKFEKGMEYLERARQLKPDDVSTAALLASVGPCDHTAEVNRLKELLANASVLLSDRVAAGFSLGKLLDDLNLYDQAFASYREANELCKQLHANQGERYDLASVQAQITHRISTFGSAFFEQRNSWGDASELPVFIVGMPRSGTTLTEQIAASHSLVTGAGELRSIPESYRILTGADDGNSWRREEIKALAESHLAHLKELGKGSHRIVDKLPGNLMHLGLIATLYPNARVIFCKRDHRDNALSCYFQAFRGNLLLFSNDLEHCGQQILAQQRMMEYWLRKLPLRHITMQYEDLVADLEGQSRRLIEFLGLDWEPQCLEFHKTNRPVLTASVWQVRQPLYSSSVGRWKHYRKHLGPLFQALGLPPDGGD